MVRDYWTVLKHTNIRVPKNQANKTKKHIFRIKIRYMYEIEICNTKNSQVERRMYKTIQQRDYWIQWWTNKGYKVNVL